MSPRARKKYVCVISDATGITARRVVRAALVQFGNPGIDLELVPKVTTLEQIKKIVAKAKRRKGFIAFTLVDQTLRNETTTRANEAGVDVIDLIGPLMTSLSEFLAAAPSYEPGVFTEADEEHYARLEAVSFTVMHDDGMRLDELPLADIVIAGPSRTSKTPLSVYLSHTRGLKVANVPLALGVVPFRRLLRLPRRKIIGLTMNARMLSMIRKVREKDLGANDLEYSQLDHVQRELRYCHSIYHRPPVWPMVNVTGKSIEEVASEVCALTIDAPRPKRRVKKKGEESK